MEAGERGVVKQRVVCEAQVLERFREGRVGLGLRGAEKGEVVDRFGARASVGEVELVEATKATEGEEDFGRGEVDMREAERGEIEEAAGHSEDRERVGGCKGVEGAEGASEVERGNRSNATEEVESVALELTFREGSRVTREKPDRYAPEQASHLATVLNAPSRHSGGTTNSVDKASHSTMSAMSL